MRLTRRERRTVVGGAALAVVILTVWAVRPFGRDLPSTMGEAGEALYARYSALAAAEQAVRHALDRARTEDAALRPELVAEADPGLASAAVLELIQGAAARSRLKLERALLEGTDSVGGALQRVAVQALLVGDVYGLRQFLFEIASAPQTLTLDQLRVDVLSGPTGESLPAFRGRAPLQVQARVSGYAPLASREEVR